MIENFYAGAQKGRPEEILRDSMFAAVNATFGTGIASTAQARTYDVTTPLLTMYNSSALQWALLEQMYLRCTTTNTASTSLALQFAKRLSNTYTSGGTTITPVSMGSKAGLAATLRSTILTVNFGLLVATAAAATTDRIVWREQVRDVILVADDTIHITFGNGMTAGHGATTTGTAAVIRLPQMWIAPGETLQMHELSPAQTADPEWEISVCWAESPKA